MNTLKAAIGVPIFPNLVQTYVLNQIATLKRSGVATTIIAENRGSFREKELPAAFNELRMLQDTVYIPSGRARIVPVFFSLPITALAYRKALSSLFKSDIVRCHGLKYLAKACIRTKALAFRPFDIFHSHSLFTSYNYLFLKEVFSVPLVTTYHGMVPRGVPRLRDDQLKQVFIKGDLFLVNTEFAKSELTGLGCPPHKIKILPQGTDVEDFPYRDRRIDLSRRIILLTVGRLSVEKGHRFAIEAMASLANEFPTLEYHIVGQGPEEQSLAALITRLGLEERVKLLGTKTGKEFYEMYAKAHLFVLPSIDTGDGYHVETQGVVLQEAQASGIPVLASRTGGIPEVVRDGITGLLFAESDPLDLAEKIRQLIRDPDRHQKISRAGRSDVESRFSNPVIGAKLLSIYRSLIDSP